MLHEIKMRERTHIHRNLFLTMMDSDPREHGALKYFKAFNSFPITTKNEVNKKLENMYLYG